MIALEAKRISAQCRHYAMCKIDYLGTGLCPSGERKAYVSYFPQGRMDLYSTLAANLIPMTERLVDIADTCTLCGICDLQCHFVTGLRPMAVMRALKEAVDAHRKEGKPVVQIEADPILRELQAIVGKEWATNDPAIRVTYANDPFPLTGPQLPRYVVLPQKRVEEIIAYAQRLFQMRGIRTAPGEDFDRIPPNSLEILFNRYMEIYRPYLRDGRIFDNRKMEAILKGRGLSCPELDYEIFSRCMQYAVDVDWGTRLFRNRGDLLIDPRAG